ncbi:MAG: 1,4-dihydroxy-2-naphthoate polyprenyltransferase [Deltaproteobacteria bacterium]|nr:1,4-dihydroxy-2-naphthoate polyprenyltransferase [Deltaproteobacteria bacterium]
MSTQPSALAHSVAPGSLMAYVLGARPKTLLIAIAPVLVGIASALRIVHARELRWGAALAAMAGAIWLTVGANFANDVFDYEKGADTHERLGPMRVTQAGLLSPRSVKVAMGVSFALATLCGVYLTWVAGPAIVAIGLGSIAAAIAYTGGPYPLGYNGLGEVFVMLFFGLVAVCATSWVCTGTLATVALILSLAPGALAAAVLLVNNVRDYQTDAMANKRTLVVRFGRPAGVKLYALALALAYLAPVTAWALSLAPLSAMLLPLLTLPAALLLLRAVHRERGEALNRRLAQTAALLTAHAILLSLGLIVT